jgi:CheY-like chemotaxis protein
LGELPGWMCLPPERAEAVLVETPSLLITDDDSDFRETLREVFDPRGFNTILASDGEEALQILEKQPVHLLLLDMHMPRITGLEVIQRVRAWGRTPPWILLSAALDDAILRAAREAAAFSVLAKPVRFAQITDVVAQVMRQRYNWDAFPNRVTE